MSTDAPPASDAGGPVRPHVNPFRQRFEESLLACGLINRRDLDIAAMTAARDGGGLEKAVVQHGFVTEAEVYARLAEATGMELVDLTTTEVGRLAARVVPERVARRHGLVPISEDGHAVTYAIARPFDDHADRDVAFVSGRRPTAVLARPSQIAEALDRAYPKLGELEQILERLHAEATFDLEAHEEQVDPDSPVVRLCNYIVSSAVQQQASDVHVEPAPGGALVRCRVHGILETLLKIPEDAVPLVLNRFKILARADITVRSRPQDGAFRVQAGGRAVDVRLSTLPTVNGEKMVLRIIDSSSELAELDALGFDRETEQRLRRALARPDGLVLVTGPTGCGKTTTLYAALRHLRNGHTNLVSVEDPVERRLQGVNQIPVNTRAGTTFATVLRSVLRQDPNVLMVGEIRDVEVAQIVGQAAYTGHLVLSTVHTGDAATAITRLLNLGLEPFKVAESLAAVVAQRLIRRLCPACRITVPLGDARRLGEAHGIPSVPYDAGPGCDHCRQTGYLPRIAVGEVLVPTDPIREAILAGASASQIRQAMRASGCRTMRETALLLVAQGITTLAEVNRVLADEDGEVVRRKSEKDCVLVVDDDRMMRLLVKLLLESAGLEVLEAENGRQGLDIARRERPDLLMLDLMMPELDGYGTLEHLRNEPLLAMTPVLVLTAENGPGAEQRVLALGADDYLTKPFDPEILLARVKGIFRRARRLAA